MYFLILELILKILFLYSEKAFAANNATETQMIVRLALDPLGFDWNRISSDWLVAANIMEGLVQYNEDLSLKPALAQSWNLSADRKVLTFQLKPGVRWSDGEPLAAQHFCDSWERVLNPESSSPHAALLFDVIGAKEYNANTSRKRDFSTVGIRAISSSQIEVRLKNPVPYIVDVFSYRALFPIRKDLIEKTTNYWSNPTKIAVIGPYMITEYVSQKKVVLKRNPFYYGKAPAISNILMPIVTSNQAAVKMFLNGDLDFVSRLETQDVQAVPVKGEVYSVPSYLIHYIGFNVKQYPFNMSLVRQAFSMAIDRNKLNSAFKNAKIPLSTYIPPALAAWGELEQPQVLPFDPVKARKLMREAGLDSTAGLHFELLGAATEDDRLIADFVKNEFKNNLFINAEIHLSEYKQFRTALEMGAGEIYSRLWSPDFPAAEAYLRYFLSESGGHKTGWKNTDYDRLVLGAMKESVGSDRIANYQKALELLVRKECPIIPLFYGKQVFLLKKRFKNLVVRAIGSPYLKDVTLTNE